jgi:hypothetical protein
MEEVQQQTIRTVYLGTYCPNNSVESFYAHSLSDTIKLCLINGIRVIPLFINDISSAIVAKNELLSIVSGQDYESIVFVDHNMAWDASALMTIINSQNDAMALPCAKKSGTGVIFDLDIGTEVQRDPNGYIKVDYASTAMFKLSKELVDALNDSSLSITNPTGTEVKNVFEINTQYGKFFNESIVVCSKIRELGYDIWLNTISTCANIAGNVYSADFAASLTPQIAQQSPVLPDEIKTLYS